MAPKNALKEEVCGSEPAAADPLSLTLRMSAC